MKILISGATGLVGRHLSDSLESQGHEVTGLTRNAPSEGRWIEWNPEQETIEDQKLNGFDAVIHLAGDNIADGRWTDSKKKKIRDSRIEGTRFLVSRLSAVSDSPKSFICASAIGFYGDRGQEELDENSEPGHGFLPDVCMGWEREAEKAQDAGMRVVMVRIGVVLSPNGGALQKMLLPFKMGVGGKLGPGDQFMSWVDIGDLVRGIEHCVFTPSLEGPVNLVSPQPVTNLEFTKAMGKVLGRPTIFPMPAFAARLAMGQMADDLLLASTKVLPKKIRSTGFEFKYPDIEKSLTHLLK